MRASLALMAFLLLSPPQDDLDGLLFLFQDIPEDRARSLASHRAKEEAKIHEHAGGQEINEHLRRCEACREIRRASSLSDGIWSDRYLWERAAEGLRKIPVDAARYHLGECMWNLGEKEEAIRVWETLVGSPEKEWGCKASVRIGNHYLSEKEILKALGFLEKGADHPTDLDVAMQCRMHRGRLRFAMGKDSEAKSILKDLIQEIPGDTRDRRMRTLRIQASVALEYPPRHGGRMRGPDAIAWYEKVHTEHKATQDRIKANTPIDQRQDLMARRDALADSIRINLEGWSEIDHPRILYVLEVILGDVRSPFRDDAVREMVEKGAIDPLRERLPRREGPIQATILDALREKDSPVDPEVVNGILRDTQALPDVRAAAARTIALRNTPEAVRLLCSEIVEPPAWGLKGTVNAMRTNEGIRDALRTVTSDEALKALATMAREREIIVEALTSVEPLIALLQDPSPAIAATAAETLGRISDPRASKAILARLQEKPDDGEITLSLLRGLDRQGAPAGAEEIVLPHARSTDADIRVLAHAILRQTGGKSARERMIAALADPVPDVRWHAVRGLGMAPPSAPIVDALVAWLPQEKDLQLQYQILKVLHRMTGARIGPDPGEWTAWWARTRDTYDPTKIGDPSQGPDADPTRTVAKYFTLDITSKRLVFLLDISGSMEGEITVPEGPMSTRRIRDKKITIAKRELIKVLETFEKDTSYNIFAFGTDYTALWKRLKPGTKTNTRRAIEAVRKLAPEGSTNIFDTLSQALQDRKVDTIYLLSDGEPTSGAITDPDEILGEIQRLNGERGVKIHTIDLSGHSFFMNRLSKQTGGRYVSALFWE